MKIFNWVHKKLNGQPISEPLRPQKGEVRMSQSQLRVQKEENLMVKSGDQDTEALLGWREGLLAIGTLGFITDPHPHPDFIIIPNFSFRKTNPVFDFSDDRFKDEEYLDATMLNEDENPLVLNVYNNHEIEKEEIDQRIELIKTEEVASGKGDRTTLADLFKADPTETGKNHVGKSVAILRENREEEENEQMGKLKKFPISFSGKLVKKLIPGHDAVPIKKINHMMRKMMKRKIHPELLRQRSGTGTLENQFRHSISERIALLQSDTVLIN